VPLCPKSLGSIIFLLLLSHKYGFEMNSDIHIIWIALTYFFYRTIAAGCFYLQSTFTGEYPFPFAWILLLSSCDSLVSYFRRNEEEFSLLASVPREG
jgi:hypothetical protein